MQYVVIRIFYDFRNFCYKNKGFYRVKTIAGMFFLLSSYGKQQKNRNCSDGNNRDGFYNFVKKAAW